MERLVVLSAHPELYTPRRLIEEAQRRGWQAIAWVPDAWWTRNDERVMPNLGWLLARPGTFSLRGILQAHRALCRRGLTPVQSRHQLLDACDQWRTLQRLKNAGLPVPESRLLRSPTALLDPEIRPGPPPWILKARVGSKGSHVMQAEDSREMARVVTFLWGQGNSTIVQPRHEGLVQRLLVVGSEVVAAAAATPPPGDFRSNWHRGGRFQALIPKPRSTEIAIRACAALGLPFGGVDVIGEGSPAILEVNASPGVQGLEELTGKNLAGALLDGVQAAAGSRG